MFKKQITTLILFLSFFSLTHTFAQSDAPLTVRMLTRNLTPWRLSEDVRRPDTLKEIFFNHTELPEYSENEIFEILDRVNWDNIEWETLAGYIDSGRPQKDAKLALTRQEILDAFSVNPDLATVTDLKSMLVQLTEVFQNPDNLQKIDQMIEDGNLPAEALVEIPWTKIWSDGAPLRAKVLRKFVLYKVLLHQASPYVGNSARAAVDWFLADSAYKPYPLKSKRFSDAGLVPTTKEIFRIYGVMVPRQVVLSSLYHYPGTGFVDAWQITFGEFRRVFGNNNRDWPAIAVKEIALLAFAQQTAHLKIKPDFWKFSDLTGEFQEQIFNDMVKRLEARRLTTSGAAIREHKLEEFTLERLLIIEKDIIDDFEGDITKEDFDEKFREELGEHVHRAFRDSYPLGLNNFWKKVQTTRGQLRNAFIRLDASSEKLLKADLDIENAEQIINERVEKALEGFSEDERKKRTKELRKEEKGKLIDARISATHAFVINFQLAREVAIVLDQTIPHRHLELYRHPRVHVIASGEKRMQEVAFAKANRADGGQGAFMAISKSLFSNSAKGPSDKTFAGRLLKQSKCLGPLKKLSGKQMGVAGAGAGGFMLLLPVISWGWDKVSAWWNPPAKAMDLKVLTNPAETPGPKLALSMEKALDYYVREGFSADNISELKRFFRMHGDFKWGDEELDQRFNRLKENLYGGDLYIDQWSVRVWARSREENVGRFRQEAAEIIFLMHKRKEIQMARTKAEQDRLNALANEAEKKKLEAEKKVEEERAKRKEEKQKAAEEAPKPETAESVVLPEVVPAKAEAPVQPVEPKAKEQEVKTPAPAKK
jgi:hypothetical protein